MGPVGKRPDSSRRSVQSGGRLLAAGFRIASNMTRKGPKRTRSFAPGLQLGKLIPAVLASSESAVGEPDGEGKTPLSLAVPVIVANPALTMVWPWNDARQSRISCIS